MHVNTFLLCFICMFFSPLFYDAGKPLFVLPGWILPLLTGPRGRTEYYGDGEFPLSGYFDLTQICCRPSRRSAAALLQWLVPVRGLRSGRYYLRSRVSRRRARTGFPPVSPNRFFLIIVLYPRLVKNTKNHSTARFSDQPWSDFPLIS